MVTMIVANTVMLLASAGFYVWRAYTFHEIVITDSMHFQAQDVARNARRNADGVLEMKYVSADGFDGLAAFDIEAGRFAPGSAKKLVDIVSPLVAEGILTGTLTDVESDGMLQHVVMVTENAANGRVMGAILRRYTPGEDMWEWFSHELQSDFAPIFLPLFVVSLLVSAITVRQSLRPLRALSQRADELGSSSMHVRLPPEGTPSELWPLIKAVNRGLDRVAEAFESQRRFTASAAHELRTPLAVLKARCSSMPPSDVAQALTADIDRMARVVDQLLSVARLEARRVSLDHAVDPAEICRQVIANIYPLALAQGRDLALNERAAPLPLKGNDIILADALRNLVENALRLSPPGATVEVELAGPRTIRVLDRGPGITDEQKGRIFEPFHRGPGERGGGAGLGLSIAVEAVRLHGGTITITDRDGGGAVFTVDLTQAQGVG